jgi:hypothetical protein
MALKPGSVLHNQPKHERSQAYRPLGEETESGRTLDDEQLAAVLRFPLEPMLVAPLLTVLVDLDLARAVRALLLAPLGHRLGQFRLWREGRLDLLDDRVNLRDELRSEQVVASMRQSKSTRQRFSRGARPTSSGCSPTRNRSRSEFL